VRVVCTLCVDATATGFAALAVRTVRVAVRFGVGAMSGAVAVVSVAGVAVSIVGAGVALTVGSCGAGCEVAGCGCDAGASCARAWVEVSARAAAIAGRALVRA
jgi:hypothetical protein